MNKVGADTIWQMFWRKLQELVRGISGGDIYYINGPDTLPAPLSKEEERLVFDRLEQADDAAKQELIVHNLRLVVYSFSNFESSCVGVEDLISIGPSWLVKAVKIFGRARRTQLAT